MTRQRVGAIRRDTTGIVVVVDSDPHSRLVRSITGAVAMRASSELARGNLEVEVVDSERMPTADVALIVVNESTLESAAVWEAAARGALVATATAMRSGEPLSALHTMAWLRAGARGVAETSALVLPEVVELALSPSRTRLLAGVPAGQMVDFRTRILDDWPSDDEGDRDRLCFQAAVALGQLPHLTPAPGSPHGYGFPKLAIALNARVETTGFAHNINDLRRALSRLTRLWTPDESVDAPFSETSLEARVSRSRLPQLARQHGFPRQPPDPPGVPKSDVPLEIYRVLEGLHLESLPPFAETPLARVTLTHAQSTHRGGRS